MPSVKTLSFLGKETDVVKVVMTKGGPWKRELRHAGSISNLMTNPLSTFFPLQHPCTLQDLFQTEVPNRP